MVIKFADSAQVVSNYTGDRRLLASRIDSIEPSQASTSLARGASGRRRSRESVEADRRGRRRLVGCHPQAFHLHRRRVCRRRRLQPGQPRARSRRDRAAAPALFARGRRAAGRSSQGEASATHPTTSRSWRFRPAATKTSPRSTSSSAGFTTSAPRRSATEAQLYRLSSREAGRARHARRRDRA